MLFFVPSVEGGSVAGIVEGAGDSSCDGSFISDISSAGPVVGDASALTVKSVPGGCVIVDGSSDVCDEFGAGVT